MTLLLQLSDPHFGTERPAVAEALRALVQARRPQLLLLSGDITQRAAAAQFAAARAFVDSLGVPAVPGHPRQPRHPALRPGQPAAASLCTLFARLWRPSSNRSSRTTTCCCWR